MMMVESGAVAVNEEKVTDIDFTVTTDMVGADGLMLRKGKCRGVVRSIKLAAGESAVVNFESTPSEQFPNADLMVFCGEGKATAALNGESVALTDLHAALVKNAVGVSVTVTAQEASCFMIAEVQI